MITHDASSGGNGTVQDAPIPSATTTGSGAMSTTSGNTATSTSSIGTYLLYTWLAAVAIAGTLI